MNSVKKFMSPAPMVLRLETTLEEAALKFMEKRVTSFPVLDFEDAIAGVLTDYGLVKMFIRRSTMVTGEFRKSAPFVLGDFYDEFDPVLTIDADEPIYNAFKLIVQSPNHRIFALEKDGKLCGALSPKDLIPFLASDVAPPKSQEASLGDAAREIQKLTSQLYVQGEILADYSMFFDNSPFMLHSVNFNGKIVRANKLAHIVLGYEPGKLAGMDVKDIYPRELHAQVLDALEAIQTQGFNPLVNTEMVCSNGNKIKTEVASMLKKDAQGNPECTITVSRPTEVGNMIDYLRVLAAA